MVTVTGPGGTVDVVLAADASLNRIMHLLVEEVGADLLPPDSPRWAVYDSSGRVLAATSTLLSEGVVDGDLLQVSATGRPGATLAGAA
jgi:hypothetical protein